MTRLHQIFYWLIFFAVLANIDLGLSIAGLPMNLQRVLFAFVTVIIIVDAGMRSFRNVTLPKYSAVLLAFYSLLLLMELFHAIRLLEMPAYAAHFILTLFLVGVLTLLKHQVSGVSINFAMLVAAFVTVVVVSILMTSDIENVLRSIALDGRFYNSMRLRSDDARNIVNNWAAGIAVGFVFLCDMSWLYGRKKTRRILVLILAAAAGMAVLLSASRAALALFLLGLILVGMREVRHGGKLGIFGATVLWGGVAVVSLAVLQDSAMYFRLTELFAGHDASATNRLSAFSDVADLAESAFLLGHGQRNVTTENTLLWVFQRYGVVGVVIFLAFWARVIAIAARYGWLGGFFSSVIVTVAALMTNDLLFFPVALFVIVEALDIGKRRSSNQLGVDRGGGVQPV